jgi:hypothetical protein
MSRVRQLMAARDRAKERVTAAERRFNGHATSANPPSARYIEQHRRLKSTLKLAQRDVAWIQQKLEQALDVEGINL